MRLRIRHETTYRYETPAARAIEILRLTPRGHDSQFVVGWRIEIDRDCRLVASHDPFGNAMHSFTVEGPLDGLVIVAEGEVETQDTNGIISGQVERMPPEVFLRETPLTAADAAIQALAGEATMRGEGDPPRTLHEIMGVIGVRMACEDGAPATGATAVEALAAGRGICRDFAHVFIAAARHRGIPARYVSGYLFRPDGADGPKPGGAAHAWAEALVPRLGWVAFDPSNGISATDAHVRVAVGLDYLGAAPVRGTRYGGSGETVAVRVAVGRTGRAIA
ncbi:MAG TPA: transglutaminase family protein [Bauldia sp.]|nr:transglutaminase family protein [Bauldia sp.]